MGTWFRTAKAAESPPAVSRDDDVLARAEACKQRGNEHLAGGELDAALACYREAVAIAPDYAEAWNNLGFVCLQQSRNEEAMEYLERALALSPQLANAHYNHGLVCLKLGRLDAAQRSLAQATELSPESFLAHYNLAMVLRLKGLLHEAAASLYRAATLSPEFTEAHYQLGNVLREQGRLDAAIPHFNRTIELKSDHAEARNDIGVVLMKQGKPDEATAFFREALRLKPDFVVALINLADALHRQGSFDEALTTADAAIALAPATAEPRVTKALALKGLGRMAEAEREYREALEIAPTHDAWRSVFAVLLLAQGKLSEGWEFYRHRFFPGGPTKQRPFRQAQWNGEDLRGKTLLLWGDQGIGDEIMFGSMLPELVASAERCIIECTPKLVPLFARSFPTATVVPRTDPPHPATRERAIDFQIAVADAARWLRPDIDSFPRHDGYLFPDPARVAYWKTRVAEIGPGPKVGICWRSSVSGSYRNLHYTRLDQWGPVFAVPGIHFVSLQYDECAEELDAARQRFGVPLHVFPEVDLYNDLHEAAALTKAMDLMIGAATAATTLATAQGVPTWGLGYSNHWIAHGTDGVPWFPSERLFVRRWDQPWEEIIALLAERLRARRIP